MIWNFIVSVIQLQRVHLASSLLYLGSLSHLSPPLSLSSLVSLHFYLYVVSHKNGNKVKFGNDYFSDWINSVEFTDSENTYLLLDASSDALLYALIQSCPNCSLYMNPCIFLFYEQISILVYVLSSEQTPGRTIYSPLCKVCWFERSVMALNHICFYGIRSSFKQIPCRSRIPTCFIW